MSATLTNCAWCGYPNRDAAAYCGDCGRDLRLAAHCDSCGAANPNAARFCDSCGTSLGRAAAAADPAVTDAIAVHATAVATIAAQPPQDAFVELPRLEVGGLARYLTATGVTFVLIVAVALVLRLADLSETPPNVTADEADNLQVVYHIRAGTGPGFFGLDWKPAPAFSTYLIAGSLNIFGESIFGLRMASVVLSVVAITVFYVVARQSMSRGAALAAMLLMATGLWFLHFSRSGWENAHVALYALLATLALGAAVRRGKWYLYALVGIAAALGVYGYIGGRVIIVGVLAFLPFALLLYPEARRRTLVGYGVALAVFVVLIAPQAKTAFDDWDYFNRRTDAVSVLGRADGYQGDEGLPAILAHQVWRTIDGFLLMDSGIHGLGLNARYVPPGWAVLDRVTGLLFWLGLLVSLRRWRVTALWWVMLFAMLFPTQVLSTGTPDAARAVGAVPFYYLFAGLGLHWLLGLSLRPRFLVHAAVTVLVLGVAYYNVTRYHQWMDEPGTAVARQPAVEINEFEQWQRLQIVDAEAGRWGFNVGEWHRMRDQLAP